MVITTKEDVESAKKGDFIFLEYWKEFQGLEANTKVKRKSGIFHRL